MKCSAIIFSLMLFLQLSVPGQKVGAGHGAENTRSGVLMDLCMKSHMRIRTEGDRWKDVVGVQWNIRARIERRRVLEPRAGVLFDITLLRARKQTSGEMLPGAERGVVESGPLIGKTLRIDVDGTVVDPSDNKVLDEPEIGRWQRRVELLPYRSVCAFPRAARLKVGDLIRLDAEEITALIGWWPRPERASRFAQVRFDCKSVTPKAMTFDVSGEGKARLGERASLTLSGSIKLAALTGELVEVELECRSVLLGTSNRGSEVVPVETERRFTLRLSKS